MNSSQIYGLAGKAGRLNATNRLAMDDEVQVKPGLWLSKAGLKN